MELLHSEERLKWKNILEKLDNRSQIYTAQEKELEDCHIFNKNYLTSKSLNRQIVY